MTDEARALVLERMADVFIVNSLETFNQHEELGDGSKLMAWSDLQHIIDNVNDHNEMILEAIETVSEDVADLVHELMNVEDDEAQQAWMALVNTVFNTVARKL